MNCDSIVKRVRKMVALARDLMAQYGIEDAKAEQ